MTKDLVTISVYADNVAGVLHRIATSFTKRKINIETLTVSETSEEGISLFTITVKVEQKNLEIILKQIERIVEVRKAFSAKAEDRLTVGIALTRVKLTDETTVNEIHDLISNLKAEIIYQDSDSAVIEYQGDEHQIKETYKLLSKFEIQQFVTSGPIALTKKFQTIHS